jgi:hypothetical protein
MDFLFGLLTGTCIAGFFAWEALKEQYRFHATIRKNVSDQMKEDADRAVKELLEEREIPMQ